MVLLLKFAVRGLVRFLSLVLAYNLVAFDDMTLGNLAGSLGTISAYAAAFTAIGAIYDLLFGARRSHWRYASIRDIVLVVRIAALTLATSLAVIFLVDRGGVLPRSAILIAVVVDLVTIAGLIIVRRIVHERGVTPLVRLLLFSTSDQKGRTALLLVGPASLADAYLRGMSVEQEATYAPAGIIADDARNEGFDLRGVRVLGTYEHLEDHLLHFGERDGQKAVLFLDDDLTSRRPAMSAEFVGRLRATKTRLLRMPRLTEMGDGAAEGELKEIKIEDLLAREPINLDQGRIQKLISGKRVLVTGAGGSIGSEICRQVSALGCAHISLLDNSEFALFSIGSEIRHLRPTLSQREVLCDVRVADRVSKHITAEAPDIVFHAAALKHVPMVENHPCEGVLTNVIGTWNVALAAAAAEVEHLVFISTDKAVEPSNIMGATKRLAESVIRSYQEVGRARCSVVRFGNVLGSAGSVVPIFKAQIERGGPVTVTHPEVERFFMTIPEAVQLVLHATARSAAVTKPRTGVYVLDMGKPVKILQLAKQLIELYGKTPDHDIQIKITGLRPGEKLTEELVDSTEVSEVCDPGVLLVTDRISGSPLTASRIRDLLKIAESGNDEKMRAAVIETLALVRGEANAPQLLSFRQLNS